MTRTERIALPVFLLLGLAGFVIGLEGQAPLPVTPTVAYPIIVRSTGNTGGLQVTIANYSTTTRGIRFAKGMAGTSQDPQGRPLTAIFVTRSTVDTVGYLLATNRCGTPGAVITVTAVSTDSLHGFQPAPVTNARVVFGALMLVP